jgi:hypothetical protein
MTHSKTICSRALSCTPSVLYDCLLLPSTTNTYIPDTSIVMRDREKSFIHTHISIFLVFKEVSPYVDILLRLTLSLEGLQLLLSPIISCIQPRGLPAHVSLAVFSLSGISSHTGSRLVSWDVMSTVPAAVALEGPSNATTH